MMSRTNLLLECLMMTPYSGSGDSLTRSRQLFVISSTDLCCHVLRGCRTRRNNNNGSGSEVLKMDTKLSMCCSGCGAVVVTMVLDLLITWALSARSHRSFWMVLIAVSSAIAVGSFPHINRSL